MVEQPASLPYVDAPLLAGLDDTDHWAPDAARVRLDRLSGELPFRIPPAPRFAGGNSNDVWDLGDTYLHVCWRADRDRLLRDARLRLALPPSIPHAPVHDFGRTDELSWVVSGRVPGESLLDHVASPRPVLRELFRQFAGIRESLHRWVPPPALRALLAERPTMDAEDPLSVWGADLVPLPTWRARAQLELAKASAFVDAGLIDAAGERIAELAAADPLAGDPASGVVVHGDPWNCLALDGRITAMIDFEWARMGPRDLDLVVPLYLVQRPPGERSGPPVVPYLDWLEEDYPALFEAPDLERRLWLYELCFCLRGVIWWPPCEPEAARVLYRDGHPLHGLRRLVEAPFSR